MILMLTVGTCRGGFIYLLFLLFDPAMFHLKALVSLITYPKHIPSHSHLICILRRTLLALISFAVEISYALC